MRKADISVVIPVYNVEAYLEHCLQSVVTQDFVNYDVVCVDDGSTDGSAAILDNFAREYPFIRIESHGRNLGLPAARNTGVMKSGGDYLLFVDSDDFIAPFCLSSMFDVARLDQVDLVTGAMVKCDDSDGRVHTGSLGNHVIDRFSRTTVFDEPRVLSSVVSVNKLIKRRFIELTGLYFPTQRRRFEDMLTFKWLLHGATVSTVPEITYFYRQRLDSGAQPSITKQRGFASLRDRIQAYADLADYVIANGHFGRDWDPLTSKHSNTKLDAGLCVILPAAVRALQSEHDGDEAEQFLAALRELFRALPGDYVEGLGKPLTDTASALLSMDAQAAAECSNALRQPVS